MILNRATNYKEKSTHIRICEGKHYVLFVSHARHSNIITSLVCDFCSLQLNNQLYMMYFLIVSKADINFKDGF